MGDTDKKLIRAAMTGGTEVILHDILFTVSMFLGKNTCREKKIKIQAALLLEKHAPPFPLILSPSLLPPACDADIKLPCALYFHAAK